MEPLRILQLIDSLELGGAERMAVNYANALAARIECSALVATRKEGPLKEAILKEVHYLFLERKKKLDLVALRRLCQFCKSHQISHIHAHGTSYFMAVFVKVYFPSIKIVWHDHNGNRVFTSRWQNNILNVASRFFSGIMVVNKTLATWATSQLRCANVLFVPNFVVPYKLSSTPILKGEPNKRILCLANLRWQKNQSLAIEAMVLLKDQFPDWTLHIVGNGLDNDYGLKLQELCQKKEMTKSVYFYENITQSATVINEATICVLTSVSEGLPLVVLEYGLYQKPIVVTAVGELPLIIENGVNGGLVAADEPDAFVQTLHQLMDSLVRQQSWGAALQATVHKNYTEQAVLQQYLTWINTL
jgi:glycosyltransferase involved in cell wall biosynthesis